MLPAIFWKDPARLKHGNSIEYWSGDLARLLPQEKVHFRFGGRSHSSGHESKDPLLHFTDICLLTLTIRIKIIYIQRIIPCASSPGLCVKGASSTHFQPSIMINDPYSKVHHRVRSPMAISYLKGDVCTPYPTKPCLTRRCILHCFAFGRPCACCCSERK